MPYGVFGCWEWTRSRNGNGYGKLNVNGRTTYAHRYAYEVTRGSIVEGLQLDHLCRNRACCNPFHLEAVTQRENIRRGQSGYGLQRTVCSKGHPLSEATAWHQGGKGGWKCKQCHRELVLRRYHERRLQSR